MLDWISWLNMAFVYHFLRIFFKQTIIVTQEVQDCSKKSKLMVLFYSFLGGRNCKLRLTMTDERNTVPPFSVRVRVTDVTLQLVRNEALNVFPMMQTAITAAHLLVSCSDSDPDREVRFAMSRGPRNGRILLRESPRRLVETRNFTQRQVNESRVFYEHNRPFNNLTIYDAVALGVSSEHATGTLEIVFRVAISVSAMMPGGIDRFIGTDDVTLEEGGTAVVAPRDLNTTGVAEFLRSHRGSSSPSAAFGGARIVLQLSKLPERGYIVVNGVKARTGQPFLQSDIDRGFVTYHHDHSDTTRDHFGVAVLLEGGGMAGDVVLFNGVWNVTILPVNDQKFRLVTDSPSMTVVQRQAKALSGQILLTEDPDNTADEIVYDVINSPLHGRLVFAENLTFNVAQFTQMDVDRERVVYLHDGTLKPVDFYFRVSDGKFQPVYRHFRIHVVPLEIKLVNRTVIPIQQGTRMAYISSANMGILTNGQRSYTFYNVTGGPRGGQIYMSDAPASVFGQINVDNEEVMYMQTDMSLANDSFTCTIQNQDAALLSQRFDVEVIPLLRQRERFAAYLGDGKTAITQKNLDATQLSGLTNSNPVYFVLESPRTGSLMRIVKESGRDGGRRGRRSLSDREVWQFTHEDVKNGIIHYVPATDDVDFQSPVNDSFVFRLLAPGVQPANGVLPFTVYPEVRIRVL